MTQTFFWGNSLLLLLNMISILFARRNVLQSLEETYHNLFGLSKISGLKYNENHKKQLFFQIKDRIILNF